LSLVWFTDIEIQIGPLIFGNQVLGNTTPRIIAAQFEDNRFEGRSRITSHFTNAGRITAPWVVARGASIVSRTDIYGQVVRLILYFGETNGRTAPFSVQYRVAGFQYIVFLQKGVGNTQKIIFALTTVRVQVGPFILGHQSLGEASSLIVTTFAEHHRRFGGTSITTQLTEARRVAGNRIVARGAKMVPGTTRPLQFVCSLCDVGQTFGKTSPLCIQGGTAALRNEIFKIHEIIRQAQLSGFT
jgi:hypothetical protein